MVGVAEAMAYAEKSGLNPEQVLKSITTGAAGHCQISPPYAERRFCAGILRETLY
ncbi:hypothetical protein QNN00_21610 [Bacillus velezensis]|nr:hypothetical protein [Bacillus velezensis]